MQDSHQAVPSAPLYTSDMVAHIPDVVWSDSKFAIIGLILFSALVVAVSMKKMTRPSLEG